MRPLSAASPTEEVKHDHPEWKLFDYGQNAFWEVGDDFETISWWVLTREVILLSAELRRVPAVCLSATLSQYTLRVESWRCGLPVGGCFGLITPRRDTHNARPAIQRGC